MSKFFSRRFDFAHLGGGSASAEETASDLRLITGAPAARAAAEKDEEDDERKRKDDESDDDYAKRMKKLDDDAAANKNGGKKNGESDDCDDDEDDKDDPKAEASVRVAKAEARGARRMQRRIGKILSSPAAARNMKLAAKLACNTMMAADEAIVIVEESPSASGNRLEDRMSRAPVTRVPNSGGTVPTPDAKVQASWDAAFAPYRDAVK